MNRVLLVIVLFAFAITSSVQAQHAGLAKSNYGIQTGYKGIWAHIESRLSNEFTLKGELGLDGGIWRDGFYDKTVFMMIPVVTLEPRWWYKANKGEGESKGGRSNKGNFISMKTSYYPDLFVITNSGYTGVNSSISIIPTWGIRRNIGRHFNYEAGIGIGYRYIFEKHKNYVGYRRAIAGNLHLRIGYRLR